ncbi:MAG: O-antigen ligase family protein [Lautropia sp.]|nr:O-antigen ligase family protein [Lautropia sp.]
MNLLLTGLLALMILWVPNQLHLPSDLGLKGLNSINLLFLSILCVMFMRQKDDSRPAVATPMKGIFIAYFLMLIWGFVIGQVYDRSQMMLDLTALKNSIFFMSLYFVFFHAVRDVQTIQRLFFMLLFVAAVAGLEAIKEGIDYGFGVYGETKRAAGPFGADYKASNLAAVFFAMFIPVFAAVAFYMKGKPLWRIGGMGGTAILLIGIFCTYSRQAYLIVAVLLLLMAAKRNLILGVLIALAVMSYESWVPEGVVQRLAMTTEQTSETGEAQLDESTESRFILWEGAGRLIMGRPWGIGLNHFKREIGSEQPQLAGLDAHNFLVLITTEAGLLGGILTLALYAALCALAWRFWRAAVTADQRAMAAGFAGATLAVMLGNLYGSRLLDGAVTGNYWILAALAARYLCILQTRESGEGQPPVPGKRPSPPKNRPGVNRQPKPAARDADGRLVEPAG